MPCQSCLHEAYTFAQKAKQKQEAAGEAVWFWFQKIYKGLHLQNFLSYVTLKNKTSYLTSLRIASSFIWKNGAKIYCLGLRE